MRTRTTEMLTTRVLNTKQHLKIRVRWFQLSTFCRGSFGELNFFLCYQENYYAIFVTFFRTLLTPPSPPTLSHFFGEKKYKGIKLSAFNRNSNIQECICGGVCLSSVIANKMFQVLNMHFDNVAVLNFLSMW